MSAATLKQRMLDADNAPIAPKAPSVQKLEIPAGCGEPAKTVEVSDDYAWIRGKKWPTETVDEPEIIKYLTQENDYCKDFLKSLETHQESFFQTLKVRIKLTDETVRTKKGPFWYYSRTEEALQYNIDCRKEGDGPEEILVDRNKIAEGKKFCKVLASTVSKSGRLMAYRSDFVGDENYKLTLTTLPSDGGERQLLPESGQIEQISQYCFHEKPSCSQTEADNPIGVFYAVRNANLRPTKVFYHRLGTAVGDDKLVFESKNDMYTLSVSKSSDGKYVKINYGSNTDDEVRAINVGKSLEQVISKGAGEDYGEFELELVRALVPDIQYSADHAGNAWFLFTKEGCTREHFRVMRKRDEDSAFSVLLPEEETLSLSGNLLTKSYLCVTYLNTHTGQPKLLVLPNDVQAADVENPAKRKQIFFPNVDPENTSHDACFSGTSNYEEDLINVAVDTPVTPTIWYAYPSLGATADDLKLVKKKEVPNFDPSLYATERIYVKYKEDVGAALHPSVHDAEATAAAVTKARAAEPSIPVTILYKKNGFKKDGSMPLLLNGYGSYGCCEEPVWSNLDTLYADLGFVVATAHIRGGGDLGEPWYQAAKFLTKKRTFYDFVNVAKHLASPDAAGEKYTSPGNVAIVGGSAGGMLVGACLNLEPSLFRAIVAHVPFVTVLDTMLDGDLPLTPGEFKEWGNPREAGYFDYMRSYCPYENVDAKTSLLTGSYPSIFATTGLTDYRVGYYEGAKWIAKIRSQIKAAKEEKKGGYPGGGEQIKEPLVVMETNMAAGHAGASGRFDRLKEVSRDVAFLATEFGLIQQ